MDRNNRLLSSLGSFLRTLFDLMLLNLLWAVCVLPVITFGPATSALCHAELRLVRDEPLSTLRDFFAAFRRGFGQGVALGLIGLAGLVIAVTDFRFALAQTGGMRVLFLTVAVIVSALVLSYFAYAFALHARYENSLSGTIKNALSLAFVSPDKTLQIWLAFALPVAAALMLPLEAVIRLGFFYILFGVSAPAWFAARSQRKVFDRFDGAAKNESKN